MPQENEKQTEDVYAKKDRSRRLAKKIVIALIVIAVVSVAGNSLIDYVTAPPPVSEHVVNPEDLYEPHWGENILENRYYMGLDRAIHYKEPSTGAEYALDENDLAAAEPYLHLFRNYFESLVSASRGAYLACFSEQYLTDHGAQMPREFTMQMVYDIHIEPYRPEGETRTVYLVEYKIHQNDGTFRSDVLPDAARPQLFYLVEEGAELVIDDVKNYTTYK